MSNQSIFTFNDHQLRAHYLDNQIWFESKDISKALGYADYRSVTGLYANYKKEFKTGMTDVVESTTSLNLKVRTRIFSLRGVHLIAMFARTPVAEEFRKWVLDILDKEVRQFDKYRKNGLYSLLVSSKLPNQRIPHPTAFAVFLYLRFMIGSATNTIPERGIRPLSGYSFELLITLLKIGLNKLTRRYKHV